MELASNPIPPRQIGLLVPAVQEAREAAARSETYYKITFSKVLVTSYQTSGSG